MKHIYGALLILFTIAVSAQEGMKRPDIPGELMVDVGFNVWSSMPGSTERRTWSSKSVGIYYSKRKAFGSKLSLNYGIGLGLEKMSLGNNSTLLSNRLDTTNMVAAVQVDSLNNAFSFSKNRLATTYLDIPIEFRFHPFGTEDGEGLFLGVGGIVGLRLKSHIKQKYDYLGETVKEKTTGKYNLNPFRYGYQIRAGFRGVHVFYKRYISDVFQDPFLDGSNPVMTTIGINVTGF